VDFRILGPLEVFDDGRSLSVASGQRRAVLIDLLLHANQVVGDDRLIDDLWGERPPPTAHKIVQLHISTLRRTLGADRITRTAPGYMLRIGPGELDADRARAATAPAAPLGPAERVTVARAALAEWRGRPLIDVEYEAFARDEIERLEELRLSLLDGLYAAELELGHHIGAVPGLEALVAEQPLREHPRALLMLALYRSGRQTEALDRYRDGRTLLARELGLDPSRELQRLERQILEHDPTLAHASQDNERPRRSVGRRGALVAAAAGAAALAAGALLLLLARSPSPPRLAANTALEINPRGGRLLRSVRVGATPSSVAATKQTLWVANFGDSTVTRVDLGSGLTSTVGTPAAPTGLALGAGSTWVASRFSPSILRIDSATGRIAGTASLDQPADAIAFGAGAVWAVSEQAGTLMRIDGTTLRATVVKRGLSGPSAVAVARNAVWIVDSFSKKLLRYDARTGAMASFRLTLTPEQLTIGCGSLWLTNPADNEVTEIDERSLQPHLIAVGTNPISVSAGGHDAWVINDLSHSANEIDCHTAAIAHTVVFGANRVGAPKLSPTSVAVAPDGTAWITLQSF
jgi:DNA-binding SARP family transcriptional activator/DNA-binding beta-propeller fold protein YncE